MNPPDLSVQLGPLRLKNPVTVASGTYGYGTEFEDFYDPARLGALFLKGLTLEERTGNVPQRLVETPSGLLNAIGLQNVGFERFVDEKLPTLEGLDTAIVANVCGSALEDYVELASKLAPIERIDAIELNISCPNVRHGGMAFGCLAESAGQITREVRRAFSRCMIVKLSPNVTDIARIALRMAWQCARAVKVPVIGQGGIGSWSDAAEFILAGCAAVSIGTANFVDPLVPIDTLEGLERWLAEAGLDSVEAARGALIEET